MGSEFSPVSRERLDAAGDPCVLEEFNQVLPSHRGIARLQNRGIKAPSHGAAQRDFVETGETAAADDVSIPDLSVTLEYQAKHHRTGPRLIEDRTW